MFQSIATLSLSVLSVNKVAKARAMSAVRDRNACREGSLLLVHGKTWRSLQGTCFKSKLRLTTLGKWATTHRRVFFLGQELLLDLTAWINLASNADNTITVYQLPSKFQNTF